MSDNKSDKKSEDSEDIKPPSPIPASNETQNEEPKLPKKFTFLTGRFRHSSEIPKWMKEEYRRERERANGTHLKKLQQMNDPYQIFVTSRGENIGRQQSEANIVSTAAGPGQISVGIQNSPENISRATQYTLEDITRSANRTSQFHHSGIPFEGSNAQRDPNRLNWFTSPANNFAHFQRAPGYNVRQTLPPRPYGSFRPPHNLPKPPPRTHSSGNTSGQYNNFQNIRQPCPYPYLSRSLLQLHSSNNRNPSSPIVSTQAESQYPNNSLQNSRPSEATFQPRNEQYPQGSIDTRYDYELHPNLIQSNANGSTVQTVQQSSYGRLQTRNNTFAHYEQQPGPYNSTNHYVEKWLKETKPYWDLEPDFEPDSEKDSEGDSEDDSEEDSEMDNKE